MWNIVDFSNGLKNLESLKGIMNVLLTYSDMILPECACLKKMALPVEIQMSLVCEIVISNPQL